MKRLTYLFILVLALTSCKKHSKQPSATTESYKEASTYSIIIHGGAGTILRENMSPEKEAAYKATLESAIRLGHTILKQGGSSLDAVQKTISVLEDAPLFNAGKGAVFTHDGKNEHDASIMDGKTLNAGACAGTTLVKNPISLARAIMDHSPHVMLSGDGANTFAKTQGLELVDPSYFYTEARYKALEIIKKNEISELRHHDKAAFYDADINDSKFGTVGCVALDSEGNLAAGTSTGGMTNKRWGRIGDAPIIGAGTYANNHTCAVSSTGWGEYFIRGMVAYDISALMAYKNLSLQEATKEVIQNKLADLGGAGGVVAIDKNGTMVAEFNTAGMYRASMDDKGELTIGIYKD